MTAQASLQRMLAAMPRTSDRASLITAHRHAEAFHAAMAEALEAEGEIEDGKREGDLDPYWERRYREELGKSAVALQRMPIKWAAVLNERVTAEPAASVAAHVDAGAQQEPETAA